MISAPEEKSFISARKRKLDFLEYCVNIYDNVDRFMTLVPMQNKWIDKYNIKLSCLCMWM